VPLPRLPLPAPNGGIAGVHDAEITPGTIIPPGSGERLDLDYAIYTCLANEKVRADRPAEQRNPYAPSYLPLEV
jgi:hypothetical protein